MENNKPKTSVAFSLFGNINQNVKDSVINSQILNENSSGNVLMQQDVKAISWDEVEEYIECLKEKGVDEETLSCLMEVFSSGKYLGEKAFQKSIDMWKEQRKGLSDAVKKILTTTAEAATIGSFILQLLV